MTRKQGEGTLSSIGSVLVFFQKGENGIYVCSAAYMGVLVRVEARVPSQLVLPNPSVSCFLRQGLLLRQDLAG